MCLYNECAYYNKCHNNELRIRYTHAGYIQFTPAVGTGPGRQHVSQVSVDKLRRRMKRALHALRHLRRTICRQHRAICQRTRYVQTNGIILPQENQKIIFAMLYTHDECLQVMCIVSLARVMISVRSRLHVVTSMTWDSHEIRTCECILRHGSL